MSLPPGWRPREPEVKPGVIALRPMTVGDLLGGVFATVRAHWRPLLTLSGVVAAVAIVVFLPVLFAAEPMVRSYFELVSLDPDASTTEAGDAAADLVREFVGFLPWLLVAGILQMMMLVVIDAGTALVVSRAVLGQQSKPSFVLAHVVRSLPKLIGLGLIIGTAVTAGLLLCIIPGLLLATFWFAAPASATLEHASTGRALGRSWSLVSKSFWRVLGVLLLAQIILGVALQVISIPITAVASVGALASVTDGAASTTDLNLVLLSYLAMAALSILAYPFVSVAKTLEYLDLRMRHEALAPALIQASSSSSRS